MQKPDAFKFGSSVIANGQLDSEMIFDLSRQIRLHDTPVIAVTSGDVAVGKIELGLDDFEESDRSYVAGIGNKILNDLWYEGLDGQVEHVQVTDEMLDDEDRLAELGVSILRILDAGKVARVNQHHKETYGGSSSDNDVVIGRIARAVGGVGTIGLFTGEVNGVLEDVSDQNSVVPLIGGHNYTASRGLIVPGHLSAHGTGGGTGKLDVAWEAVAGNTAEVGIIANGRRPEILRDVALRNPSAGTWVINQSVNLTRVH